MFFDLSVLDPTVLVSVIAGCVLIGGVIVSGSDDVGDDDQPTPVRKRRRRREERGLPDKKALRSLARTYLKTQHRLWPELKGRPELPDISNDTLEEMAERFCHGFLSNKIALFAVPNGKTPWDELASGYLRYSCDNSNPRSLDQQLQRMLERAHQNGHFVPWNYVFADAAVTGTTAARGGYQLAKEALKTEEANIAVLYIDEIGRAARDMIEALQLGRLIEYLKRRLIGVSDGFDTDIPMWKTVLSVFAALQEWFIDQLRSKVNRGMLDAFRRGTNVGLPAVGYKLVDAIDVQGQPMYGKDGSRLKMLAIDESAAKYVRLAFRLYADRKWSRTKIARHFNARNVGGRRTWDSSRIRQLLRRWKYVGIDVYGTKRQWIDAITGDVHTEYRPRSEWNARRVRHLQMVSWSLWKRTQQRLREVREAYRNNGHSSKKRCDLYPKTLVRPICGECGEPMSLGRSGKYASFTCLTGRDGKEGCTFKGYKSVRIVEKAILDFLSEEVLTESRVGELVTCANQFIKEEAGKPKQDVAPIKAEMRKIRARADRLGRLIEDADEDELSTLVHRLKGHEKRLKELAEQLRLAEVQNDAPVPLDVDVVKQHLGNLRSLLRQDVAVAAPIIRELTGPVVVRQRREEGRDKPTWFAEFTVDMMSVMRKLARDASCPTTSTLEYLDTRSWTLAESVEVCLRAVPTYERIAMDAMEMTDRGTSIATIASALNTSWVTVQEALAFARTGKRPGAKPTGNKTRKRSGPPKYLAIREEVVRRHGVERQSLDSIAHELHVSQGTVRRAWDSAHREEVQAAAAEGRSPCRGSYRRLPPQTIELMREMILLGESTTREIAAAIGVSDNTVRHERAWMLGETS